MIGLVWGSLDTRSLIQIHGVSVMCPGTLNLLASSPLGTPTKQVCITLWFTWTGHLMSRLMNQQQQQNKQKAIYNCSN